MWENSHTQTIPVGDWGWIATLLNSGLITENVIHIYLSMHEFHFWESVLEVKTWEYKTAYKDIYYNMVVVAISYGISMLSNNSVQLLKRKE